MHVPHTVCYCEINGELFLPLVCPREVEDQMQIPGLMPFQQRKIYICNLMVARLYLVYESYEISAPTVCLWAFFK